MCCVRRLASPAERPLFVEERALYGGRSDLYDRLYFRADLYEHVAGFVQEQLGPITAPRILDLCAGTGSHARFLSERGAVVVGVDQSAAMLEIARQKVPEAAFVCADVRSFALHEKFHAVTCLYGAVHYLEDVGDVRRVFDRVVEHLLPGGVAVFELRDGRNLDERPLSEERDGLRVTTRWQKRCGARGSDLYLVSAYEPSSGLDFLEAHNLFLLRPSLFVEQARRAGFAEISLFAGYTSEPYRVEVGTDVAVLVARSPRSERAEHR
jgi:SAM-dependent methyltransferase